MKIVRPVSDLQDHLAEISETAHATNQPIFLTKNGCEDLVILSREAFENLQFETEVYCKLQEAEREAERTDLRYSSGEVMKTLRAKTQGE